MNLSLPQYALAKNLGLMLWLERTALVMIKPAQLFATLGIILSQKLVIEAEYKLFEGMLNVLSLETAEYWIGRFDEDQLGASLTVEHLATECKKWRPYAILGLGISLREMVVEQQSTAFQNVQFTSTYHPQELIENPTLKRKTYRDLLNLKETLSLIKAE